MPRQSHSSLDSRLLALLLLGVCLALPARSQTAAPGLAVVDATSGVEAPSVPGKPYAARALADRIVLTPGADPARQMGLAWRTDAAQETAEVELAPLAAVPNFGLRARRLVGASQKARSENGVAVHHRVRLDGLEPDTAYAYRVKGAAGWSEWHQFRTAAAEARPFTFLYFGDTQNSILAIGSLAWRRAFLMAENPVLVVHAGDLVSSRADLVHDDEWGEWAAAGGFVLASIPQLVAAGNHEYVDVIAPDGSETRRLGAHWQLQFELPRNGAPGAEATTYMLDWQGVRFIVLDGTSALDLGTLESQTAWLEAQLQKPRPDWTVVTFHQPIYTCARPDDTEVLKAAWVPLFERYGVDLVLQGHDHCYSRLTAAEGREAGIRQRRRGAAQGPVYMVSVAGSKMYALNDRALTQPDRVAEDTLLFQTVAVTPERLSVRAHLVDGSLYDAFELVRHRDGRNRLREAAAPLPPVRRCDGGTNAAGLPCTARGK